MENYTLIHPKRGEYFAKRTEDVTAEDILTLGYTFDALDDDHAQAMVYHAVDLCHRLTGKTKIDIIGFMLYAMNRQSILLKARENG